MFNTKQILREELFLENKKALLSEQSLILINDYNHVNYVLGIKTNLNETYSFELRKRIIEEQIIYEEILSSISKFVGTAIEKGKEKTISVVNAIKNTKDIALLFKDLYLSPEYMQTATNIMGNKCNELSNTVKQDFEKIKNLVKVNIDGFFEKLNKIVDQISDILTKLATGTGWKGFLTMLAFSCLVVYIKKYIFDKLLSVGAELLAKVPNLINGLSSLLNSFKEFSLTIINKVDIQPIIEWFTEIGVGSLLGSLFVGVNIINILKELLTPIISSIDWGKRLAK
jgi:hypothetical protein